jgi:hypothetical protein
LFICLLVWNFRLSFCSHEGIVPYRISEFNLSLYKQRFLFVDDDDDPRQLESPSS